MKKKPWLAALLNVLVTGLGYLYVGKRVIFGIILIIVEILGYVWAFTDLRVFPLLDNPLLYIVSILYIAAFALDAYKTAKEV
jgi:uncharacterized membrane-anchored protein YitT (DUF2179 family)